MENNIGNDREKENSAPEVYSCSFIQGEYIIEIGEGFSVDPIERNDGETVSIGAEDYEITLKDGNVVTADGRVKPANRIQIERVRMYSSGNNKEGVER